MNGGIAKKVRNLCEVHLIFPNQLLGELNLHAGKEINHTALVLFPKQLLQLGSADEIVVTDIFDGQIFPDMFLQIKQNFIVGGRAALEIHELIHRNGKLGNGMPSDHVD